jgi:hypothetical protein
LLFVVILIVTIADISIQLSLLSPNTLRRLRFASLRLRLLLFFIVSFLRTAGL